MLGTGLIRFSWVIKAYARYVDENTSGVPVIYPNITVAVSVMQVHRMLEKYLRSLEFSTDNSVLENR